MRKKFAQKWSWKEKIVGRQSHLETWGSILIRRSSIKPLSRKDIPSQRQRMCCQNYQKPEYSQKLILAMDTGTWYLMKSQSHWWRSTPHWVLLLEKTTYRSWCLVWKFPETNPPSFRRTIWSAWCTWWHGYIWGWWHWWTGWWGSRQKLREISEAMQTTKESS